jgi:hypothetical protein
VKAYSSLSGIGLLLADSLLLGSLLRCSDLTSRLPQETWTIGIMASDANINTSGPSDRTLPCSLGKGPFSYVLVHRL